MFSNILFSDFFLNFHVAPSELTKVLLLLRVVLTAAPSMRHCGPIPIHASASGIAPMLLLLTLRMKTVREWLRSALNVSTTTCAIGADAKAAAFTRRIMRWLYVRMLLLCLMQFLYDIKNI